VPLDVLIVPDKFKGTLTAAAAAAAMARGWQQARPEDRLQLLPMSDGGDGFGEILGQLLGSEEQGTKTVDAAHRSIETCWWWHSATQTAVIESARIIGLAQLPPAKFHPFELDTEGVGLVLQAAAQQGARRCLVGIGGSATNDGGFGVAKALGWQFFNSHGERILRWTELHTLSQVRPPERGESFEELTVAVDVQNPLLGPRGCTRVYGPQKGLRAGDFEFAERCLESLSSLLARELHLEHAADAGAGAAGGLGFGFACFAGAKLVPGFDLFARHAGLAEQIRKAELVITGEGSIDESSIMGKGVGEVASLCRQLGVPCLGLAGVVSAMAEVKKPFAALHALAPDFTSVELAKTEPTLWLERLANHAARNWRVKT